MCRLPVTFTTVEVCLYFYSLLVLHHGNIAHDNGDKTSKIKICDIHSQWSDLVSEKTLILINMIAML